MAGQATPRPTARRIDLTADGRGATYAAAVRRLRFAIVVVAAGAVLASGACGDDDDATTATTAEATSTTIEGSLPTNAEDYATALIEAWERGDHDTASTLAAADALDVLFSQEGGGAGTWSLESCDGAAGSTYCTFGAGGDPKVIVRVANEAASLGQPEAVTEVQFPI